jgi:hypothetical protein
MGKAVASEDPGHRSCKVRADMEGETTTTRFRHRPQQPGKGLLLMTILFLVDQLAQAKVRFLGVRRVR